MVPLDLPKEFSLYFNFIITAYYWISVWKNENQLNIKFHKVPVFVRGQKCTPITSTQNNNYTENENNKSSDSIISENCDMLVVDWKNMAQIKITNITELQISDLLQFKVSFYYYTY